MSASITGRSSFAVVEAIIPSDAVEAPTDRGVRIGGVSRRVEQAIEISNISSPWFNPHIDPINLTIIFGTIMEVDENACVIYPLTVVSDGF